MILLRRSNVGGTGKDLTDNVNVMANNVRFFFGFCFWIFERMLILFFIYLTLQLRTIAVATVCFSFVYNVPYCCQPTIFFGGRRLPWLLEI